VSETIVMVDAYDRVTKSMALLDNAGLRLHVPSQRLQGAATGTS